MPVARITLATTFTIATFAIATFTIATFTALATITTFTTGATSPAIANSGTCASPTRRPTWLSALIA
jgi:hypothetical protein